MSPEQPPLPIWARLLVRAQLGLAVAAAFVIVICTVADVVLRYGFGAPIQGAYDVVQAMLVVLVFHGMALVFDRRANITIDLVDHVAGPAGRAWLIRLADLVQLLVLVVVFCAMLQPARQAFDYGDRMLELGLKLWVLWVFALSGIAGTALIAAARTLRDLRAGGL